MNGETHIEIGPRSSVSELIEALSALPGEFDVDLFGEGEFYLHVDYDNGWVTITDKDKRRYEEDAEMEEDDDD